MRVFLLSLATACLLAGGLGDGCARCHEIAPTVAQWKASSHRGVACERCHGGTLQAANAQRLALHLRDKAPEHLRLRFDQVEELVERCRSCHQAEHAAWSAGPHGSTMARLFTDEKHNRKRTPMDDCLRCHGMFFDRGIRELLVSARQDTFAMANEEHGGYRAIPCVACHSIHTSGVPHAKETTAKEKHRPSLAFWDRRTAEHIAVALLPLPVIRDGERIVQMSPDQRQRLCYQCHAPLSNMQVWSGDDRTPVGVHEGLSCLACHAKHGQSATASCASCHPRLSNCGLDVEQMDTTFRDLKSRHNIHTVRCADCHPKGIPKPRVRASR